VSGTSRAAVELARVRAEITERRKFRNEVTRAREFVAGATRPFRGLTVRCEVTTHSHRGSAPKLADVAPVLGGLLVVSTIKWRPSDQLNLPPWDRESYLGAGLDGAALERVMSDDQALIDWLDMLDRWERGGSVREDGGHGPRWLMGEPPRVLATVLFPDRQSPMAAWVRCPRQGGAETVTYRQLAAALR